MAVRAPVGRTSNRRTRAGQSCPLRFTSAQHEPIVGFFFRFLNSTCSRPVASWLEGSIISTAGYPNEGAGPGWARRLLLSVSEASLTTARQTND